MPFFFLFTFTATILGPLEEHFRAFFPLCLTHCSGLYVASWAVITASLTCFGRQGRSYGPDLPTGQTPGPDARRDHARACRRVRDLSIAAAAIRICNDCAARLLHRRLASIGHLFRRRWLFPGPGFSGVANLRGPFLCAAPQSLHSCVRPPAGPPARPWAGIANPPYGSRAAD